MAQLDELKDYIATHQTITKLNEIETARLQAKFDGPFRPEIFSTPESDKIYFGFKYKYNILYKKEIDIINNEVVFGDKTIIVGERYTNNIRNKFDEELFEQIKPHLDVRFLKFMKSRVMALRKMRIAQNMSKGD